MSLLIKGVEMPDSCLNCRFRTTILKNVLSPTMRTSAYACLINGMEVNNWYEEKHKNCPLVEVPTPHGRLIDADKFFCKIDGIKGWDYGDESDMAISAAEALSAIDDSPTVIEAEANK